MSELPCANGGGSINNPDNPSTTPTTPYVPPNLCTGDWSITDVDQDLCAQNEQINQESYIAETINIAGAPLNIFPLKGIHQQGNGSVLDQGQLIASTPYPGYPKSNINNGSAWRSIDDGPNVAQANTFLGVDFGIKMMPNVSNIPEYEPHAPKWTDVGSIEITQSNDPNFFARQVKVEISSGECEATPASFVGNGDGPLTINNLGVNVTPSTIIATAISPTEFDIQVEYPNSVMVGIGRALVGQQFYHTLINFTISNGSIPFSTGDSFQFNIQYKWLRVGLFNLIQSPNIQVLNLKITYKVKAIRITPTLFTGTGNWEVLTLDVFDSPPTDINNIQDLFFGENRDRDYATTPIRLKAQYTPADSVTDLSKFGLSILDQYSFTVSFANMVHALGRPIVVGDIVEVIPELQWDQNLKPIRKFLEVTDSGWSSGGFSPAYKPLVYRFNAQIALPSQETRDIFGTMDTQKYMVPDSVIANEMGNQLNVWPMTAAEELNKAAINDVPETGTDDIRSVGGVVERQPPIAANDKGQPPQGSAIATPGPNLYIEAGLPPNGEPYGEGYILPDVAGVADGVYFRLYYPQETNIPPRLYRFSLAKNRWIFMETDRRSVNNSVKPSLQKILQSSTNQPLGKK